MYTPVFTPGAYRIFKKFTPSIKKEIVRQLRSLRRNPLKGEQLRGKFRNYRSYHFGFQGTSYRVIYLIDTSSKKIFIQLADKRENIYKRLDKMGV